MRTILMIAAMLGLMSTVGVYAASFGGGSSVATIGGTGSQSISAPTAASVDLTFTLTDGEVSAAVVDWTPSATGDYTLSVDIDGTSYTATGQAGVSATPVTHTITVSPAVASDSVSAATVTIMAE